ncbi:hypothetical protein BGX33_002619 [Mortierella sp. NVP41]|nr:hypothetical protein BGX33_002619 [Mortierella sp. NVP41]
MTPQEGSPKLCINRNGINALVSIKGSVDDQLAEPGESPKATLKRSGSSTTSEKRRAGDRSDDEWIPTTAAGKNSTKSTASERKLRACTAKPSKGQPEDTIVERFVCVEIPVYRAPSCPPNDGEQEKFQVNRTASSHSNTTQTATHIELTIDATIDSVHSTTSTHVATHTVENRITSPIHYGTCDPQTLIFNNTSNTSGSDKAADMHVNRSHSYTSITKESSSINGVTSKDDTSAIGIDLEMTKLQTIDCTIKFKSHSNSYDTRDLYSPSSTSSPDGSGSSTGLGGILTRSLADQDNVSIIPEPPTEPNISPTLTVAIESTPAHIRHIQGSEALTGPAMRSQSDGPEPTFVDSGSMEGDFAMDTDVSDSFSDFIDMVHSQSPAVAITEDRNIGKHSDGDILANDSNTHPGQASDALEAPFVNSHPTVNAPHSGSDVNIHTTEIGPQHNQCSNQSNQASAELHQATIPPSFTMFQGGHCNAHLNQATLQHNNSQPDQTSAQFSQISSQDTPRNTSQPDLFDPLTGPFSKFANADINKVISYETYTRFSDRIQRAFVQLLPECIRSNSRYISDGVATQTFFNTVPFGKAKLDWQKALTEGKFTDEYVAKIEALKEEKAHPESWKSDDYESFYGEQAIRASVEEMDAGDSAKTTLAKICLNKGINVGDRLRYHREFPIKQRATRMKPKGKAGLTMSEAADVFTGVTTTLTLSIPTSVIPTTFMATAALPTTLSASESTAADAATELATPEANRENGDCRLGTRDGSPNGTNTDPIDPLAATVRVEEELRVIEITKSGRPIMEFVETLTDKDEKESYNGGILRRMALRRDRKGLEPASSQKKTSPTYKVDSAAAIERLCLERDGRVPKSQRKHATESWKRIEVIQDGGRSEDDDIYLGSLFAIRMDIYNHLQNEKAKEQVLREDAMEQDERL